MRSLALLLVTSLVSLAPSDTHNTVGVTRALPNEAMVAGPPWISVEYPVNPYDQTTKRAFLVVHAFHHGVPTSLPVSGTAEGLVDGQRRSIPLKFDNTARTGAYALPKQWPANGVWTLALAVAQGEDDRVWAVVDLSPSGDVAGVRVPTRVADGHTLPAPLAMADIDRSLRSRASQLANK